MHRAKSWLSSNSKSLFEASFPQWVGWEGAGGHGCPQPWGQNCHLAEHSVVFRKLSFADQSSCAPPLPVVSLKSVSIPGDSTGAGQAAPPLWLNQHWRLWTKRADWALQRQSSPGDTHMQNVPRKTSFLGYPDSSRQRGPEYKWVWTSSSHRQCPVSIRSYMLLSPNSTFRGRGSLVPLWFWQALGMAWQQSEEICIPSWGKECTVVMPTTVLLSLLLPFSFYLCDLYL